MEQAAKSLDSIRGWLLLYVIWVIWGAAFSLYTNGADFFAIREALPVATGAAATICVLVIIYYGLYCWTLADLLRKKQGVVRRIRLFIATTPLFNAALPAIFVMVLLMGQDGLDGAYLISQAYTPGVIGSIIGASVIAVIWYVYFGASKRVKAIWPNG